MRLGKRAEQQVGLARAAMPRAEQQPLAADVGRIVIHKSHQRTPNGPSPAAASLRHPLPAGGERVGVRGWYGALDIAMPRRNVSRQSLLSHQPCAPPSLDRLFAPVTVLPGVGPQLGRLIERAAGPAVVDLLVAPAGGAGRPPRIALDRCAPSPRLARPIPSSRSRPRSSVINPAIGRRPYRVFISDGPAP